MDALPVNWPCELRWHHAHSAWYRHRQAAGNFT